MTYEKENNKKIILLVIHFVHKVLALLGDSVMIIHLRCSLNALICFLMTQSHNKNTCRHNSV